MSLDPVKGQSRIAVLLIILVSKMEVLLKCVNSRLLKSQTPFLKVNTPTNHPSSSVCGLTMYLENRGNWGGAVSVLDKSDVCISSSKFIKNNASCGGAFWVVDGSSVNMTDCLLSHNQALEDGGAVEFHNHVKATISKSVFECKHLVDFLSIVFCFFCREFCEEKRWCSVR